MADRPSYPGTPRWLKVSGFVLIVLVLLAVVIVRFTGLGGPHGPEQFGPGQHDSGNTSSIDGATELTLTADELAFDPNRIELTAGEPINVALSSTGTLHELVVDEIDFYLAADRDAKAIGGMVFDTPGTYVGYCSVEGHREKLEIVVAPSEGS